MSLKHNLIANYLGQGWASLMGLAFVPMYIHYLGIEAYGLIGLFAVIQAWFVFLDMGLSSTLTREMARFTVGVHSSKYAYDLLRSIETIGLALAVVIGTAIWVGSDYLAVDWLKAKELSASVVAESLSMMAIVVTLRFCEGIYRGALFGLQMQVWFNAANASLATLRHAGSLVVLAFISPTLQGFFFWQAMISLLSVLVFAMRVYKVLPKIECPSKFSTSALLNVWQFAGGMMTISFFSILLTQVDKVLLSRMLTLDSFGAYMLAATIASVLYATVVPITQAFYPSLIALVSREDQQELINKYHLGAQTITVLTTPIAFVLYFLGENVIFVWSGDATLAKNIAPVLAPLVLGTYLNGLMHMPYQLQLAHGWTGFTIKVNTVALAVFIPLLFWVVPRYGSIGAAWIWVSLNMGYFLLGTQFMHRKLLATEKISWYFEDVLLPMAGAIAAITLLKILISPVDYEWRWVWLILLLMAGGLSTVVAAMLATQIRLRIKALILLVFKSVF